MNWKKKDTIGLNQKTVINMSVLVEKADLSLKYTAHYSDVKEQLFEDSSEILNAQRGKAFQDFVIQGIPTQKKRKL